MRRDRLIRDPIYDYISLPTELAGVVDQPLYQRLRRIAQTSLTSLVYPSATGSRFEHGLGAMHLGRQAWAAAWRNATSQTQDAFAEAARAEFPQTPGSSARAGEHFALVVACVALLHDVGHPPFSHVLEDEYQRMLPEHLRFNEELLDEWRSFGSPLHEFAGVILTRRLASYLPGSLRATVLHVYESDPDSGRWGGAAHSVVSGEIDVDRLDYLMRDARKAGTEFGAIDYSRLIDSLELHHDGVNFRIAPGVRGRSAVETLLMQRSQSYKWITYHHRVVGSNLALSRAVANLRSVCESDDAVRVEEQEQPLSNWFSGHIPNLNYLAPSLSDVATALTTESHDDPAQLPLDDQLQADWISSVIDELRAGVDDSAITEWLQRGSLLARVLLHRGQLTEGVRSRLLELVTYSEAALLRAKNFMPTWKTVEEFAGAARGMAPALIAAVQAAFGVVEERLAEHGDLLESMMEQRAHLIAHLERDPIAGTNRLFGLTASSSAQLAMLRLSLQAQQPNILDNPGFWDVDYTSFKPVRMAGNLTVLYRGDDAHSLLEHSPLVRSLEEIERHRPKLFAFFFLRSPLTYRNFDADRLREARITLTGEFITTFPNHVRQQLPESLLSATNGGSNA